MITYLHPVRQTDTDTERWTHGGVKDRLLTCEKRKKETSVIYESLASFFFTPAFLLRLLTLSLPYYGPRLYYHPFEPCLCDLDWWYYKEYYHYSRKGGEWGG